MGRRSAGSEKRCAHQERGRQASGGNHAFWGLTELKRQFAFIMFSRDGRKVFLCERCMAVPLLPAGWQTLPVVPSCP
ncbi:hypothetical protein B932_0420 [Gluconobacter oxydans H24]|nr:hypothetical protein B932_0420 [Gluconobacter oxydans H24]